MFGEKNILPAIFTVNKLFTKIFIFSMLGAIVISSGDIEFTAFFKDSGLVDVWRKQSEKPRGFARLVLKQKKLENDLFIKIISMLFWRKIFWK